MTFCRRLEHHLVVMGSWLGGLCLMFINMKHTGVTRLVIIAIMYAYHEMV